MGLTFKPLPKPSQKSRDNATRTIGASAVPKAKSHRPVPRPRGAPLTAPKQVGVPEAPHYDPNTSEKPLYDEQQVARVELLMLKGIRDRRQLMALLEIDGEKTIDRYINRVYARWEMIGSTTDYARHRGEGLKRLDTIERELWSKLQEEDDAARRLTGQDRRNQTVILKTLLDVHQQRTSMLGLTPKVIERIAETDPEDMRALQAHRNELMMLGDVARRMLEIVKENAGDALQIEGTVADHADA